MTAKKKDPVFLEIQESLYRSVPDATTVGVRYDSSTGQFVPQLNGKDISPTSFDKERACEIARQALSKVQHNP